MCLKKQVKLILIQLGMLPSSGLISHTTKSVTDLRVALKHNKNKIQTNR